MHDGLGYDGRWALGVHHDEIVLIVHCSNAMADAPCSAPSGKRLAYLVMPSYQWAAGRSGRKALDPAIIEAMVEWGLLPDELSSYGRQADDAAFRSTLTAYGFTVYPPEQSSFSVTQPIFKETLSDLVSQCDGPDDVLAIVYCGHGHQELFTRHASLVLSDNRHVTSHQLDRLVSPAKGTVYTVLNCCYADAVTMALPIGSMIGPSMRVGADSLKHGEDGLCMAGQRRVDILSSTSSEGQKAAAGGTAFANAFKSVLLLPGGTSPRRTPLQSLQHKLQAAITRSGAAAPDVGNVVVLLHCLSGYALCPVSEEPKVRAPRPWGSLFD